MWERLEQREITRRKLRPGPADRPRPDLPAGSDLIPKIKHIVILMMENHSYDNYLGMLKGRGDGLPLGADGAPDAVNTVPDGRRFVSHHFTSTRQLPGNPTQSWRASHIAYADGSCDGFAASVLETVPGADPSVPMGYWTDDDLPFYYGLAQTFPVADHWFCSCMGPTFPNRRFLIAGTANGLMDDLPWDLVDYPEAGTIFDALSSHGISWVNYHSVRPATTVFRRAVGGLGLNGLRRLAQIWRWLPQVVKGVQGNKQFTAALYPLGLARAINHLRPTQRFYEDAAAGTLPAVSLVDPDFDTYSEENPQDITLGESFAASVVNAVMNGPAWESTLLLWVYDEHGGYYDHVPPPAAVAPDDVPAHNWQLTLPSWLRAVLAAVAPNYLPKVENQDAGPDTYKLFGFRVPAVIVSPYARPGFVLSDVFDHTSVLKLIQEKWNLPPLTRRDAAAISPLGALDLDAPPAFLKPPALPDPKAGSFGSLGVSRRAGSRRSARRS